MDSPLLGAPYPPCPILPHGCGLPCFLLSWELQDHPEGTATPQPGGKGLTGRTRELVLREGKGASTGPLGRWAALGPRGGQARAPQTHWEVDCGLMHSHPSRGDRCPRSEFLWQGQGLPHHLMGKSVLYHTHGCLPSRETGFLSLRELAPSHSGTPTVFLWSWPSPVGGLLLLLWVPDLPSCLLVCLGASCDDWVTP